MAAARKTFDARLKLYEQGMKLHQSLSQELDTAEKRMLELTGSGLAEMENAP